jgi:hypothetical protein
MNRRALLAALLAAADLLGCAGPRTKSPGRLTKAKLEADMAGRLKLHDVALVDQGGGRFTGTGKDGQGRVIQLEVQQEERRLSWKHSYKSPDGKSSSTGNGTASW